MPGYANSFKILLLSDSEVDKSSILPEYIKNLSQQEEIKTIGIDFWAKTLNIDKKKIKLQLWDFGGEERFRFLLHQYCKGANGAFFLYDVTKSQTIKQMENMLNIIRQNSGDIPIYLIGIIPNENPKRQVSAEEGAKIAKEKKLNGFIEINAITKENVIEAYEAITRLMLKNLEYELPKKIKRTKTIKAKTKYKRALPELSVKESHLESNSQIDWDQLKGEVQSFLEWIKDSEGLSGYINFYLQQNNTSIISELSNIYRELRKIIEEPLKTLKSVFRPFNQSIKLYKINPDGTTTDVELVIPLKDLLKSEECYVIVSEEYRKVYLWKGKNSNVRSKFIGAKRSQDIRGQVGMHFGVVPLDEGEEDSDFLKLKFQVLSDRNKNSVIQSFKDEETNIDRDQIIKMLSKMKFWQFQNSSIVAVTLLQGKDTIL